jgi:predicted transcriptional regulator
MQDGHRSLDTTNAEHILYSYTPLQVAVLGGIRLDGLDRMRVTLKIQVEHLSLRHNLDLYNDNQTEKLIRKVAERLEVGTSVVAAALTDLTDCLEQYRLEELEKQQKVQEKRKLLSQQEIKEAEVYLSAPNLMKRTGEDIGKAGVIGEEINRLLMYIVFTSRKRESPLHVISLGSSGIGKTHLQEKVSALIPEEDKLEITTLSGNALYYFGQQELRNKLILIEDLDGADEVLYPLREIKSKKRITKQVVIKNTKGETRTVNLVVEGPVSVAGCTTKESLYEDNANRSFLLYIDESAEQDEKIMAYQRKLSAGKVDLSEQWKLIEQFQNMQRILRPVPVRNPYAEQLRIPIEVFKPRRTHAHYLAFIEAVTYYHQFQREKQYDTETGEEFIETTLEDIEEANQLMKEVLIRKSDVLSGACRNYLEQLKTYLLHEQKTVFTNREIRQRLRVKPTTLKRYHGQLLDAGLMQVKSGKRHKGYEYELSQFKDYEELQAQVSHVLDDIVAQIKRSGGSVVVHSKNGPAKKKKAS